MDQLHTTVINNLKTVDIDRLLSIDKNFSIVIAKLYGEFPIDIPKLKKIIGENSWKSLLEPLWIQSDLITEDMAYIYKLLFASEASLNYPENSGEKFCPGQILFGLVSRRKTAGNNCLSALPSSLIVTIGALNTSKMLGLHLIAKFKKCPIS